MTICPNLIFNNLKQRLPQGMGLLSQKYLGRNLSVLAGATLEGMESKNPLRPSSFPNILSQKQKIAATVLQEGLSSADGASRRKTQALFRDLADMPAVIETDKEYSSPKQNYGYGKSVEENNQIVEHLESQSSIPNERKLTWALSQLYSGYSNPSRVLYSVKNLDEGYEKHLIHGVAHGIMSQTAKEMNRGFETRNINVELNHYYHQCFSENTPPLTAEEAYENNLKISIKELKKAYKLNPREPIINYFLISQLLESGDILTGSKTASRLIDTYSKLPFDAMTFEELRAYIFSSSIAGSAKNIDTAIQAIAHHISHPQQLKDLKEALYFVYTHAQSANSQKILEMIMVLPENTFEPISHRVDCANV